MHPKLPSTSSHKRLLIAVLCAIPAFTQTASSALHMPYTKGHMDVGVALINGELRGIWVNESATVDGVTNQTDFFMADDIMAIGNFDAITPAPLRPANSQWNFVGVAAGEPIYILPSSGIPDTLPYLGFGTEHPSVGSFDTDTGIQFTLTSMTGPVGSTFNLYTSSSNIPLTGTNASVTGSLDLEIGFHDHYNWAFSHMGEYNLTFKFSGSMDGTDYVGQDTFRFQIIPEPSTFMMSCIAAGTLLLRRSRRKPINLG